MRTILRTFAVVAVLAGAGACSQQGSGPEANSEAAADETARQAHEAYAAAINTNDLDSLLAMLTEDVVYLAPNEPALVGKAAVRPWAAEYLKQFKIHWEKTSLEFVVAGDWAFDRYSYTSTDTPQGGGTPVEDLGKGLSIFHHDADGKWRVARDAWSSDLPLPTETPQ
jgi:ketosteroid isomerase-like protein